MFFWFKAAHLISVFAWMAGLFYLPRLLVYHSLAPVRGAVSEQLKIMERRLLWSIMLPAGLVSWFFGILTGIAGGYFISLEGWFALKLVMATALTVFHGLLHHYAGAFAMDVRPHNHKYFRILNEVPTVFLIAIVILVVVRPF